MPKMYKVKHFELQLLWQEVNDEKIFFLQNSQKRSRYWLLRRMILYFFSKGMLSIASWWYPKEIFFDWNVS